MSPEQVPFDHPWNETLIGNLANIIVGGTPSTSVSEFWGGSIPWMVSGDIYLRRITDVTGRITELGLNSSNAKLVTPPAVAVALAGQGKTRGTVALTLAPLTTNQSVALIKPTSDQLNTVYLFYALGFRYEELRSRSSGEGRAGLSKNLLEQIPIPLPPPEQQTAIADILTTVDRAIEQTEALIAKQRRIKAGLLHDLLTRGIDEHGRLRDPSTHRFKPSPVGLVPEEWEVTNLGSIVDQCGGAIQTGPFGSQLHAEEYTSEGVPFVMPQDISPEGVLLLESAAKIPQHRAQDLRRHLMKENDVLFARRGDLSRCAAIQVSDIAVAGSGCMLVRVPKSTMIGEWLAHVYKHERSQRQILARAVGSTMVNLNSTLLRDLMVVLPKNPEQERILFVLGKARELNLATQQELNKLATLKVGLMQDLLSGRVSVEGLTKSAHMC